MAEKKDGWNGPPRPKLARDPLELLPPPTPTPGPAPAMPPMPDRYATDGGTHTCPICGLQHTAPGRGIRGMEYLPGMPGSR